jgi:hypothetical protein
VKLLKSEEPGQCTGLYNLFVSYRYWEAAPTGFEPAISALTGPHVNRYTTGPVAVGSLPYAYRGVKTPPESYGGGKSSIPG